MKWLKCEARQVFRNKIFQWYASEKYIAMLAHNINFVKIWFDITIKHDIEMLNFLGVILKVV